MQVNSRLFGEIEIEDEKIITFESGLMGFEQYTQYALIYNSEKQSGKGIMWLQSLEESDLAFSVIDPGHVFEEYSPIVEDEWLEPIGKYNSDEELLVLCVLTVPSDLTQMTANTKAPLIINTITKKGCQIIVNNEEYTVRYNVYDCVDSLKKEGAEC